MPIRLSCFLTLLFTLTHSHAELPTTYSSCVAYYQLSTDTNSNGILDKAEVIDSTTPAYGVYSARNSPTWTTAPATTYGGITTDGKAASFNGTNQYILMENLQYVASGVFTDALYSTGSITVWARIRLRFGAYGYLQQLPLFSQSLWGWRGMSLNLRTAWDYGWAQLNFQAYSQASNQSTSNAIVLCDEWADVGVSYDATTSRGFLTFSQYGYWYKYEFDFSSFGPIIKPSWREPYIAGSDESKYFPGEIESIAFWNAALTEQDMKNMSFAAGEARMLSKPVRIALSICKIVNNLI